jgi:hypothetical protein
LGSFIALGFSNGAKYPVSWNLIFNYGSTEHNNPIPIAKNAMKKIYQVHHFVNHVVNINNKSKNYFV